MSKESEIHAIKTDLVANSHNEIPTKLGKKNSNITKTNETLNNYTWCLK